MLGQYLRLPFNHFFIQSTLTTTACLGTSVYYEKVNNLLIHQYSKYEDLLLCHEAVPLLSRVTP